jgi:PAS domain S-box-containing protein
MLSTADVSHEARARIERLCRQMDSLAATLRAEQEALRRRGMTTPPGALDSLLGVSAQLHELAGQLTEESTALDQLRALAKTMGLFSSSLDPEAVLAEVVDTAIAMTGAERAYIVLRSTETGELEFRIGRDLRRQPLAAEGFAASVTIMRQVAETAQPLIAGDALLDPRYNIQRSIMAHGPRSIICVPLIHKEQVSGVLYADNRQLADLFGEHELALLLAFANQAAIAIENARLFARARHALADSTELKQLLDNVLASIASGVITTDRHNQVVLFNRAAEQILGIAAQRALHQPLEAVLPDLFTGVRNVAQTVQLDSRQQVFAIEPVLPERGAVTLSLKLTPLKGTHGVTVGTAIVVDDLTEIRRRDATLNVVRTYLPPSLVRNIQSIDSLGLSGDEREISVIYADVRGFTAFCERLDPERLMTIISQYLTVCTDAIQLHDGIIDKYMGDAVVGLFNTQLNPQEDHAVRAVRAALSMAYDVHALHEVLPPEQRLYYGIGVASGMAVLGNVGSPSRKEFTAIGAPFGHARHLQENALAGEIILSPDTYSRVRHIVTAEALPPRKSRAIPLYTEIYRVTGIQRRSG